MTSLSPTDAVPLNDHASRLLALCDDVVRRGKELGATDVEVCAEYVHQTSVNLEQNDIKGGEVDEHHGLGIRVLLEDRLGFAYVNRLESEAIDDALQDALAIARGTKGDPANALPHPRALSAVDGLWDDAIANLPADEAVSLAGELLHAALQVDPRVSVDSGSFTASAAHGAIVSSKGVRAAGSETSVVCGLFGMAVDGDEVGSFDQVFEGARRLTAISPATLGRRFGEQVLRLLRPVPGSSYKGKVLFGTETFEEIFVGTLLAAADGDEVFKGRSRLKDKLGHRIASGRLTLTDEGTIPGAIGSAGFDREGMPHRPTVLLDEGVLRNFLYDAKSAHRAGVEPTGHATGDARSMPSIGTTNLRLSPGTTPESLLLEQLRDGLFVGRFSGSVDSVSGDFSGVAKGSFVVRDGKLGPAVQETLIAGNVFELLERIVAVGDTTHRNFSYEGPWVLVDGVDVSAAE
ncbi:MAG: TldD/PmbA family protein [Myxococcota bacterium]